MSKIQRAILSVTDKSGLVEFARKLAAFGVELVSTGGTAKLLRDSGIAVKDISELTGFPEMLDGRVKTLHPKVHGGILHRREDSGHRAAVAEHGIPAIDMVVVNLYAFEKTAAKPGVHFEELIENIDIGGPSMIRSAAKNFQDVAVVTSPADYDAIAEEMARSGGALSQGNKMAAGAEGVCHDCGLRFRHRLDAGARRRRLQVAREADAPGLPTKSSPVFSEKMDLRYGENPHQRAAMYADGSGAGVAHARQVQGKELSYNNIVDLQAAWDLAQEFDEPVCAIIKHTNPCGTATGKTLAEAYLRALECDPVSAFGGVIGVNRTVDAAAATRDGQALSGGDRRSRIRRRRKSGICLEEESAAGRSSRGTAKLGAEKYFWRHACPGFRSHKLAESDLKVVTKRPPTPEEKRALLFAWKVCKHVKSNAILYARDGQTVGVGAGQMSRVDSCKLGAMKAQLPLKGTVAASDAFFPFPDGVEEIAKAGATAIIQPGGSVRDQEVIEAADRLGLAMIFTGVRHFRH